MISQSGLNELLPEKFLPHSSKSPLRHLAGFLVYTVKTWPVPSPTGWVNVAGFRCRPVVAGPAAVLKDSGFYPFLASYLRKPLNERLVRKSVEN